MLWNWWYTHTVYKLHVYGIRARICDDASRQKCITTVKYHYNNIAIVGGVQAKRSERDGGDGLVRKRWAAGRIDQKGKHTGRRDGETQNGRWQVLHTIQQQRSGRRSAKSPDPGTWVRVQVRHRQVYLSVVQSKYTYNFSTDSMLLFVALNPI